MSHLIPWRDPGLHPYRQGLFFAFYNALNWQIATATPTVLFMAYLGADSFETGLVYGWPLLLTPIQVFATVLLPRLGFKRLTLAGWGARSWFIVVPLVLTTLLHDQNRQPAAWMVHAVVVAMFFYSLSRSVGAAAITTWLQGLVPERVRGRYWSTDQIMGGTASVGTLVLCAACFAWLPQAWAFSLLYAFSICGAWMAFRCLRALPDIERPSVMSLATIRAESPRLLFGASPFRTYLWLAVGFLVVATPLIPFGAYYLKTVAGISPASIMGYTIVQYAGLIAGNWFMRSRIDHTGTKPFLRLIFLFFAAVAAGWLICLRWTGIIPWLMPILYALLGAGTGMFTAANVSYLSKLLPPAERALPVSLHGAVSYFIGGLAPVAWGLVLKNGGAQASINLPAFQGFFLFTLVGALTLVVMVNRLEEQSGTADPLLEIGWLFRPFRVVTSLISLGTPADARKRDAAPPRKPE